MTDAELIMLINSIALVIEGGMVILIALRIGIRVYRFWGKHPPDLLIRDAVFFCALAALLLIPLVFGVTLRDNVLWAAIRSLIGLLALSLWLYYEFFVIGKRQQK